MALEHLLVALRVDRLAEGTHYYSWVAAQVARMATACRNFADLVAAAGSEEDVLDCSVRRTVVADTLGLKVLAHAEDKLVVEVVGYVVAVGHTAADELESGIVAGRMSETLTTLAALRSHGEL
nr:hypothetical protein CFP56_53645 [Quercus suber]